MIAALAVFALAMVGRALGDCNNPLFDYENFANWCNVDAACCPTAGTSKQSPIDVVTGSAAVDAALMSPELTFNAGYFYTMSGKIKNTGDTLKFTPNAFPADAVPPRVTGGPFGDKVYEFAQFHFHWGVNRFEGSEHTVDGKSHPAEIHLVHYNKAYGSLDAALGEDDGLAVLGIFFEDNQNQKKFKSLFLRSILTTQNRANRACNSETSLKVNFCSLFREVKNLKKYYTYSGSLTTPTCNEVVTWVVFDRTVKIRGGVDIWKLRALIDPKGERMTRNWRGVNPLDGRTVTRSC